MRRPFCRIVGPSGAISAFEFTCSLAINTGYSWSATVPGYLAAPLDLCDQQFALTYGDGNGFTRTTPPLVASLAVECNYSVGGYTTRLTGVDKTTWRLSQPEQSLPTFKNLQANAVIQTIAAASGVTIIAPALNFSIAEEDVKQSNYWGPLLRIAEVACCNLIVDRNGALRFIPLKWTTEAIEFTPDTVRWIAEKDKQITGFVVNKRTSHYTSAAAPQEGKYRFDSSGFKIQQLKQPMLNPVPYDDYSTLGGFGYVSFWDGDPGKPSAGLLSHWPIGTDTSGAILSTPFSGRGPAKYMALTILPPAAPLDQLGIVDARLRVSGSTPPAVEGVLLPGLDLSFTTTVGDVTGPDARPGPVRNEPLYPSEAYVQAHADELIWEANKAFHSVTASGAMDCGAQLAGRLTLACENAPPAARIERIDDKGSIEGFTSSLSGFVIPW